VRHFPSARTPRPAPRAAVALTAAAVTFLLVVGSAPVPAHATTTSEETVVALINDARAAAGVQPLRPSDRLSGIARRHSKQMANRGTLFHSSCLPCSLGDLPWTKLAENVGVGASVRAVQVQFIASDAHRANILDAAFRRVGVGVVRQGGQTWVTQIFYRR
jgi:uncharacterized protein YkwD